MSETAPAVQTQVTSSDGTPIAVFVSGSGRPLVLVPGTSADHTTWRLAAPLLSRQVAVHAVDRRGRGESGDSPDYSLARECDDIVAVVDAAAAAAGMSVDLLGHSFGGNVAYGAIGRTDNIRRLVLYEGWPTPNAAHRATARELMERLESLLADGSNELLMETFYREVVRTTEAELDGSGRRRPGRPGSPRPAPYPESFAPSRPTPSTQLWLRPSTCRCSWWSALRVRPS